MECQVNGCTSKAVFALNDKDKNWLNVCKECEQQIGDENMRI